VSDSKQSESLMGKRLRELVDSCLEIDATNGSKRQKVDED
jgi:hypothetical protein